MTFSDSVLPSFYQTSDRRFGSWSACSSFKARSHRPNHSSCGFGFSRSPSRQAEGFPSNWHLPTSPLPSIFRHKPHVPFLLHIEYVDPLLFFVSLNTTQATCSFELYILDFSSTFGRGEILNNSKYHTQDLNAALPSAGSRTKHSCEAVQEPHPQAPRCNQALVTRLVLVFGANLVVAVSYDFCLPG